MPQTPDRFPGVLHEEGIVLESVDEFGQTVVDPTEEGGATYHDGTFRLKDAVGVFNPRSGGGITEEQHEVLRQLIHFIDDGPAEGFASGAYCETLPAGNPFPTSIIWYTSIAKTSRIVEEVIVYNANKTIATDTWKIYDAANNLLHTVTDTISYTAVFETSRTRTIT